MAAFHLRSISLPSDSHPVTLCIEKQLIKLKNSPQPSSIAHKLGGLKELYDSVDDFLQLPLTQRTLSHEMHHQYADKVLNGSVRLLDICNSTRDFLLQMKECVQGLGLSLRRRRGEEFGLNEVQAFMLSKKKLNKVICKYLRNLKRQEYKCTRSTTSAAAAATSGENIDLKNMIGMLKDAEEISASMFESILAFISQTKPKSKPSGWSVVTKLLKAKNSSCQGETKANEMEKIEAELLVFKSSKDMNMVENVVKGLKALELSLQEVEEELECVYRRLVKTRVSLLNILNH